MKYRILTKSIQKALKTFPAIVVTGPRQSGKTTLVRSLLKGTHRYVNLENPDTRLRAREDPIAFLDQFESPVIFDEIQYVPELLSYIKSRIDEHRVAGQWVLTGSQNFILMHGISESLAGRVAVLTLLPFTFAERIGRGAQSVDIQTFVRQSMKRIPAKSPRSSIEEIILRGSYPEIASHRKVDKDIWCSSYITTYLERDIRNMAQVGDLNQFERFVRLCAVRTGQILNISDLARDVGISVPTAKRWLSLLEAGYQVFLLQPYFPNIGKRLVKSPKLYFNDTALAAYLLGLRDKQTLLSSPHFASLFETMIVVDVWKRFLHHGDLATLYYLRTRDGLEVDLVIDVRQRLYLYEIKSSATITPVHAISLMRAQRDLGSRVGSAVLISQSRNSLVVRRGIEHWHWSNLLSL